MKVWYDQEHDIFAAVMPKREYDSSVQVDEFIFDIDKKGKIVGIEILDFSKVMGVPAPLKIRSGKVYIGANEKLIKIEISIKATIKNEKQTSSIHIERLKPDFIEPSSMEVAVS